MRYLEIGIETQRAGIELILSALMKLGITDAVVEDPADIEGLRMGLHRRQRAGIKE